MSRAASTLPPSQADEARISAVESRAARIEQAVESLTGTVAALSMDVRSLSTDLRSVAQASATSQAQSGRIDWQTLGAIVLGGLALWGAAIAPVQRDVARVEAHQSVTAADLEGLHTEIVEQGRVDAARDEQIEALEWRLERVEPRP